MDAENFTVDDLHVDVIIEASWMRMTVEAHRRKVEVIEDIATRFPYSSATVLLLTLLSIRCRTSGGMGRAGERTVKPINLRYLSTLVVSAKQGDLIRVSWAESSQKGTRNHDQELRTAP